MTFSDGLNAQDKPMNKGTRAGGANTNKNGLSYETLTDLSSEFTIVEKSKYSKTIKFGDNDKVFTSSKQSHFFKYMDKYVDKNIRKAHGCKNPDECYIDDVNKIIFILEKKFQKVNGSVCEKIQTADFKQWQYERTFPLHKIVYMYCLSDWFSENCVAELEYLEIKNVPVFMGSDIDYKNKIIAFMLNYESELQPQ